MGGENDLTLYKQMKIIILIEKYGNHCNRLFQSLHFHSLAIEKKKIYKFIFNRKS